MVMACSYYLRRGIFNTKSKTTRSEKFLADLKYLHTRLDKYSRKVQTGHLVSDEIVISGISGRFPQADNINEFKQHLLQGTDMTSLQTRFPCLSKSTPRLGLIDSLNKFDADFFGLSSTKVLALDPAVRKLIEVVYETILDAGINPESLRGSRTAVIIGTDGTNTGTYWLAKHGTEELAGQSKLDSMTCFQANYVSHILDLRGTSLSLGTACSTSVFAIDAGVNAILGGKCDRAIVGATSLHHLSHEVEKLAIVGATSLDGVCRPFDQAANGVVRAEAVVALLLEKQSLAKRSYATIKGVATNVDGYKSEGIFHPSFLSQEQLYRELYSAMNVDPASVSYIEAHGTGTQAGDFNELTGLYKYFASAPGRLRPLLIGSVKGLMGHAEAAAGMCGLAKMVVCAQEGVILPSRNFKEPHQMSAHFFEGSVKVVAEPEPFSSPLVGISSFGIGGTNGHLILQPNWSNKELGETHDNIPFLVPFSGQNETDVRESLSTVLNSQNLADSSREFCGILHTIFSQPITNHTYRGYVLIKPNSSASPLGGIDETSTQVHVAKVESNVLQRPIWFVFPGMNTQWAGVVSNQCDFLVIKFQWF